MEIDCLSRQRLAIWLVLLSVLAVSAVSVVPTWADEDELAAGRLSDQQPRYQKPTKAASRVAAELQTQNGESSSSHANRFVVLPGFQVELLYTVPRAQQGSWVSLTTDQQGRLLASDQGETGIYRITPCPVGTEQPTKVERLHLDISSAQGMVHAFGSLYLSVNGGRGSGLYRARDTNADDQYDKLEKLARIQGAGEHGPHAVRLSPDGESLYLIAGNHTNPPAELLPAGVPSNWGEDLLLPRQWDARGHARGRLAPGGWIAKIDPDAKTWEIVSAGYRNAYDFDFNADGELFAYDADMEWDMGMPWYRPTRLLHSTRGSDFGWRSGTGKWPTYYVDSLPPVVDLGPGSPVGVVSGEGARFPAKYQRALYLLDWTFGTIYAVHMRPVGASYDGEKEEFVSRRALPLTDAVIGHDGSLYFTVGGRGTQSALYRVTYVGNQSVTQVSGHDVEGAQLRALRRRLEQFHRRNSASESVDDMNSIIAALGHPDRHIRFAARVALEYQPLSLWQDRVLADTDAERRIHGVVALARASSRELADRLRSLQTKALASLGSLDFKSLDESEKLHLLRAYALVFIRLGKPDVRQAAKVVAQLNPFFPDQSHRVNHELARVLVYLNAPGVVQKSLNLMQNDYELRTEATQSLLLRNRSYGDKIAAMMANRPELEKLHYAFLLRNVRYGWTLEERKQYLQWLNDARRRSGGESYEGFVANIKREALANVSSAELDALDAVAPPKPPPKEELPQVVGPGRSWAVNEVVEAASAGLHSRDFDNGRKMFAAAKCMTCHRFDGRGGATGPDLTSIAGRFGVKDLAEAIIEPSKVISDQYRASVIETADGRVVMGRIVSQSKQQLTVQTHPEDANQIAVIDTSDVEEVTPSATSLMPEKLLNEMNVDEVMDLFAYLLSRGNPGDLMFVAEPH